MIQFHAAYGVMRCEFSSGALRASDGVALVDCPAIQAKPAVAACSPYVGSTHQHVKRPLPLPRDKGERL
jgi:hypothetical protein